MIRSPVQDLYLSPSQLCLIKLESVSGSSRPSDGPPGAWAAMDSGSGTTGGGSEYAALLAHAGGVL